MWHRVRFKANLEDSRPIKCPPLGPWWEVGFDEENSIVVAYFPVGKELLLKEYWPEAKEEEWGDITEEIVYTNRFAKSDW